MTHALPTYPAYRHSGVERLGEIPAHWEVKRLKHAVQINTVTLPENTDPEYPLRYVDIGNVDTNGRILNAEEMTFAAAPSRARRRVQPGDTIISTVRTYLKAIAFVEDNAEDLIVSTGFATLTPEAVALPKFLWRAVQSDYFVNAVVAHSEGVGYPAITPSNLASLPVWLPPLPEQHAIAAFLDRETARLDALIAKKERLLALLAEKRAALISHAVTKGLDPNAPMQDSGVAWLGEIPAHWKVKRLKFLASHLTAGPFGSSLTKDLYTQSGYRVYGQEQVIPGDFTVGDYYIAEELYRLMSQYAVAPGDVLISCVGTFGKVAVVPLDAEPGVINPRLIKVAPDRNRIVPEYLGAVLKSGVSFGQFEQASRGGTMGVINLGLISEILIPVPPLSEQQVILEESDSTTRRLDSLLAKVRAAIDTLREYRAALISAAVTGKIDVRGEAAVHE